jgi:hypothetical protein
LAQGYPSSSEKRVEIKKIGRLFKKTGQNYLCYQNAEQWLCERLLAWANRSGKSAVIDSVVVVPQGLPEFDTTSKDIDLFLRARRSVGRKELCVSNGIKILIVPILENGFKNVLAQIAHIGSYLINNVFQVRARCDPALEGIGLLVDRIQRSSKFKRHFHQDFLQA